MIRVDESKCLGCAACFKSCPQGLITLHDGEIRIIHFARCQEDCDICLKICPVGAISQNEASQDAQLSFSLQRCSLCGTGFAPIPLLERVKSCIPGELQKDDSGQSWLDFCASCRRLREGEKAAKRALARRS
ncbi:MAG: 4Fe-4S binding protein [Methanothrix sp.]|nr:4Fe-4S binding protein [Methanothrix sp.]